MTLLGIVLGLGLAAGALLVIDGLLPTAPPKSKRSKPMRLDHRRLAVAAGAGAMALAITRWPVAAVASAALAWFAPQLLGGKTVRDAAMARTEAIATWTEMLRDTISAAHGIEAAINATAPVSPLPVQAEVRQLARRLEHEPLPDALSELADDLAHPIADLVVAALTAAATHSTRELADLLSTLANAARDEASMQLRVEATRARMRTAVRVITAVTLATALALIVLNPSYVEVYSSAAGQAMLVFIFGCWGTALWWLGQMSQFRSPERFLLPRRVMAPLS
jgi:tight adherence protein B